MENLDSECKPLIESSHFSYIMSDSEIDDVRTKVENWLREEGYNPQERVDANAYFSFGISVSPIGALNVVQSILKRDSFVVIAKLSLENSQIARLNSMGAEKRQQYFWDLRLALSRDREIAEFQISPNPPEDVREITLVSNYIFYDELRKSTLVEAIFAVIRSVEFAMWLLEKYAGASTPRNNSIRSSIYY